MVQPNSVNAKILSSLDWYPTIGALAGYELKPTVTYDGVDISDALFTDSESPRTTFFFHSVSNTLCEDGTVVSSSDDDIEIRAARGQEVFDAASHWPNGTETVTPPAACNYTRNVGVASPTVDGSKGVVKNVTSQQACCELCLADKRCATSAWHSPEYQGDNTSLLDCFLHTGRKKGEPLPAGHGIITCDTGRPPSPPPPPPPQRMCMPLVMAVRKGKYKLHMFTVGGGRPPTGRADWPPENVQGLKFG
eukprot:SAG11_NODE_505_length_8888_cov_12.479235_8_plen_249_part_00